MAELNKVSLYCKEGNSDKTYTLWLEEKSGGFLVNFNYGPRGGWIQTGTKTKEPVAKDKAQKIYEKLLAEKKAKGYTIGEDAPAFSQVEGAEDSGLRPMLLTPDTEENLEEYLTGGAWGAEQKLNGKRILLRIKGGKVEGVNRRGLLCPLPLEVQIALKSETGCVFDGELIGAVYHAFDLLEIDGKDIRHLPYATRYEKLEKLPIFDKEGPIRLTSLATGEKDKRKLYKELKDGRKEGIVFKRLDAVYEPGRREDLKKAIAVKVKFYAAISPVVIGWKKDKQSIEVGLREEIKDSKAKIVSVGWVTVPTKYVDQIKVGKPVRVKYLYATSGHQLYQAHLDPTDDGQVMADQVLADPFGDLKYEGKEGDE